MAENDFEKALERLSVIVSGLEKGDLPLEKSLRLFEEGVQLSRYCSERLAQAEKRIQVLTRGRDGEMAEVPFEESELEDGDGGE